MKTNSIFKYFALFLALTIMSCGGSDDSSTGATAASALRLNITASTGSNNDTNHATLGTDVEFIVTDSDGNDLSSSTSYTLNGTEITSPYIFTTAGLYTIHASNSGSQTSFVILITDEDVHKPMVLIEDYTGTWCGYCPRLAAKIDALALNNSSVIPVAIHNGDNMVFSGGSTLENAANVSGYPTGKINRTLTWDESDNQVLQQLTQPTTVGLQINTNLTGNNLTINVGAKFALDLTGTNKLVIFLLEDNLHASQANYMNNDSSSPWYGAGNPIPNFEHDNVIRTSFTNVLGDVIPASDTQMGDEYTWSTNYTVPASYNANNLEIVAMIVNSAGGVINSQMVKAGSNKTYELAQ